MIKIAVFLILLALIHAKLELMIEGLRSGWACRLPCWRKNNKLINLLLGKELTGYHFWLIVMFLLLFHSPFLFIDWTEKKEYLVMGLYFLYWIAEDFFWFMENPYFGLKNFKKGRIYWHRRWFLRLPVSYWTGVIIGILLLLLGR